MKASVIETKARRILQDTDDPYRWTHEEIRDSIQEAVYALNAVRPETRYVNGVLLDVVEIPPEPSEDEPEQDIDIHMRYEEAIVFYVVYKSYLRDDTDTVNAQLAESYLGKFNTKSQL